MDERIRPIEKYYVKLLKIYKSSAMFLKKSMLKSTVYNIGNFFFVSNLGKRVGL